ncbi:MBOAT family O-acyltransferase [Echinimonas agarilytica]|uniref:Probable alginate O-acetylase n=1 Tax=Echinimonas agarilytica TaxID=1215918 RepID=A0AA41WAL4_9GAMM|nr:MBOAT family protein [Echinimonas agarilytica]MCM2681223.1 MBOAT family protein [Echinimonas agarilytica]
MVFSSSVFLFLFLPLFLGLYYVTPFRYRSAVILLGSYSFYAWWRVDFLALFIAVTLWNYIIAIRIDGAASALIKKRWLTLGIVGNLSTLGYFKYANFGVDSINALLVEMGANPLALGNVILPIGISFYIFQAISYLVDVYREDTPPTKRFIDFAAFIALFPQLIAGPVLRYKDLADQFEYRTHTYAKFSEGASRFMQGFIKKVFIADTIAPIADFAFGSSDPSMADAWLGAIVYAIQLYFDFSGYSDMAIGLGLMMGFRFPENFNQPYISQSITEFWRRWHISLSSWLRDYLYIPLGGSRGGELFTYRNLFLTMLLGGLWHGANWTFVLWGVWHGGWLAVERALGIKPGGPFIFTRWIFCLFLVLMGWVLFRATDVSEALRMYSAMFGASEIGLSVDMALSISTLQIITIGIAVAVIVVHSMRIRVFNFDRFKVSRRGAAVLLAAQVPLFVLSVSKLIASSYSPFLYFQF